MPQAVALVAAKAAIFAFELASAAGASITTAATIANVAYLAAEVTVTVGLSVAASLALAPGVPKPAAVQVPLKQPLAARRSAFGRVRVGGVYALFEAVKTDSVDVVALLDGRSSAFVQFYLNDDPVSVSGTGGVTCPSDPRKYAYDPVVGDRTFIYSRLGVPTETHYSQIATIFTGWTSAHRGDGITSMALHCKQSKKEFQQEDFPNGLPQPSAVIDAQLVFDPRDEDQVQGDPTTYAWSDNPALCLMAYLTDAAGGVGLDYDQVIAPFVDFWIAAADDCDADEVTESGTERRYRCSGTYQHDNTPGDIINVLLESFDGYMAQGGNGGLVLYSGRYYAPTVTLTDRSVLSYTVQHFLPDEQATNEFVVSFTDPDADYNSGSAGEPVRWEPDITDRGQVRSTNLELLWVPSASQAIRLAKRKLARTIQPLRGSITANLVGMNAVSERYVRLQLTDNAVLNDLVVEIIGPPQIDLANLTVTFPWIAAEVTIDDGDPGGDVPIPGVPDPRPAPAALDAPTIDALTAVYDDAGSGVAGARIQIDVTAPVEADVEWRARWKLSSAADWHEATYSDIDDGAAVTLITGFVPASGSVDVQVRYLTAAQSSPWSATEVITLAAPSFLTRSVTTSEALAAGDLVNVWNSSGAKVRRANATSSGKEAHGFVLAAVLSGADAEVYFSGSVTGLSGLTPGALYLDTTAGGVTSVAPSGSGNIVQQVGVAISATELAFAPQPSTELA